MPFDFNRPIDRKPFNSVKWSFLEELAGGEDVLPLWVADADFASPDEVVDALCRRARHPVYGYGSKPEGYYRSFMAWTEKRHAWSISKDWIVYTPGVVPAIAMAIRALTAPGDTVIIQSPVYYPFAATIRGNGRIVADAPLLCSAGQWTMDFDALETSARKGASMMLLCSPHNPVGRVWTRTELERVLEISVKYDVIVVSDEIHADIVMPGHVHIPFSSLRPDACARTIVCMAPSKTFNLAGLSTSNAVIPDTLLRETFQAEAQALGFGSPNIFGSAGLEAAYSFGETWLDHMLVHIKSNYDFMVGKFTESLPAVRVAPLEGTFLAWVDFRAMDIPAPELKTRLLIEGRVWLDEGAKFGAGGEGFMRVNLACTRDTLDRATDGIISVFSRR